MEIIYTEYKSIPVIEYYNLLVIQHNYYLDKFQVPFGPEAYLNLADQVKIKINELKKEYPILETYENK